MTLGALMALSFFFNFFEVSLSPCITLLQKQRKCLCCLVSQKKK